MVRAYGSLKPGGGLARGVSGIQRGNAFRVHNYFMAQIILCSKIGNKFETNYIFFFSLQQHSNGATSRSTSCQRHCIYAPCHSENATEAGSNECTIVQIAWLR